MMSRRWTFLFLALVLAAGAVVPAAAQSANPVTTAVVASTATAIPGGTGDFTNFIPNNPIGGSSPVYPPVPAISAGNVVFWGAGSGGQQGIYAIEAGVLVKVADLATPIPAGTGDFTNFWPPSPVLPNNPTISSPFVAFAGFGADGWQGVYIALPGSLIGGYPPTPIKIADTATAIPGGPIGGVPSPLFTGFLNPALSGPNAAFIGFGADGWQGVYIALPRSPIYPPTPIWPPTPIKIADLATPIPGGAGNFTGFAMIPSNPRVNGPAVAFIGLGAEGQQGVYIAIPNGPIGGYPPVPLKIADTSTLIPGDSLGRTFAGFSDIAWPPVPLRTPTLAFVGAAVSSSVPGYPAQPFQGVYTVMFPPNPFVPGGPFTPPNPYKVADLTTPVPGGGAFLEFASVAVSRSGAVVFDAWYSGGGVLQHGLFTNITGTLMKVLDNTESVAGKPLADFSFGSGGFGGARAVFTAFFQDGSQAISAARVNDLRCSQDDGDEPCER